jgi:hypothetical protein
MKKSANKIQECRVVPFCDFYSQKREWIGQVPLQTVARQVFPATAQQISRNIHLAVIPRQFILTKKIQDYIPKGSKILMTWQSIRSIYLQETPKRCKTRTRTNHDNRYRWIGRQFEI